ncbi:MFS transporter [Skermania sp. ID1734]|nr:MFS transporter [Skermania sp. ID1734]
MADVQAGIGPFLGVFLQARGWATGAIGSVMTIGGLTGMAVTTPAGAVVDATTRKRACVVASGVCTVAASGLIFVSQRFWVVSASQVATAVAGALLGPAVLGITLGVVRQSGFNRQNGRNQAFNHAGNMSGAALSGVLGWQFGFAAVFWLAALFAVVSIVFVLRIPRSAIDDKVARGLATGADHKQARGLEVLLQSRPLLVLALALMFFHLGNGAMLPLYGLAVVAAHGDPFLTVAATIVVAQAVMVVTALVAMRLGERYGFWVVMLITFVVLPVRGVLAASIVTDWGVFPVQILDGVGAGMQSVAVPGLVARVLHGTGRVNAGQGAVMTVHGLGAALSPAIGGYLAQELGYHSAFLVLGAFPIVSIVVWLAFGSVVRSADHVDPTGRPGQRNR